MVRIAIVGGGIGGLCTAIALQQLGFDPMVYEATDELKPVGTGIGIMPNGMYALDRLDVADEVAERGVVPNRLELQTADGSLLLSRDLHASADRLDFEHGMVAIHRAELQSVLADRVPTDSLQLDRECLSVDSSRPAVRFEDREVTADLVIGADGINSAVRTSLFPSITPEYAGEVAYRGLVETSSLNNAGNVGREFWGQRRRFGYFAVDDDRVYWFAVIRAADPDDAPVIPPANLAEGFRDFPHPIADLIDTTADSTIVRTPIMDLPILDHWDRNHVTLLGDAAHATTPNLAQGSAQAMEDAIVLANSLDRHDVTRRALTAYEDQRKKRADRILRQSRIQGRIAQITRSPLIRLRNIGLRHMPSALLRWQTERMLAVDF